MTLEKIFSSCLYQTQLIVLLTGRMLERFIYFNQFLTLGVAKHVLFWSNYVFDLNLTLFTSLINFFLLQADGQTCFCFGKCCSHVHIWQCSLQHRPSWTVKRSTGFLQHERVCTTTLQCIEPKFSIRYVPPHTDESLHYSGYLCLTTVPIYEHWNFWLEFFQHERVVTATLQCITITNYGANIFCIMTIKY